MGMIPRHELWRSKYRNNPYMRHLSDFDLEERIKDIFNLILILAPDGKISATTNNYFNDEMWQKYSHALVEMENRYGPFPNGFTNGFIKSSKLVNPTFPNPPDSKIAIDIAGGVVSGRIYKFSKKKYINDMYHSGIFRIAPASYYKDPSLNSAIRDDELVFNGSVSAGMKNTIKFGSSTPSYGRLDYSIKARTNYYVSCYSSNYTYREFSDFEADACLIIKNPRAFTSRLIAAGCKVLAGYEGFAGSVKYLDPLLCDPRKIDINFSKHFKYAYQNEYRAIWAPKKPISELQEFYIDIGPMQDIAEVIKI